MAGNNAKMSWDQHCGSDNDRDFMQIVYIGHTSKLDKWLSINTFVSGINSMIPMLAH